MALLGIIIMGIVGAYLVIIFLPMIIEFMADMLDFFLKSLIYIVPIIVFWHLIQR